MLSFPVIVQDQQSPNYRNGETGEAKGAYVNGRKGDEKAKNLKRSLATYHKNLEKWLVMSHLQGAGREARKVFNMLKRLLQQ